MVVVTTSISVMPVLFAVMPLQGKRLVLLRPGGLVVSEDKLLLQLQKQTRLREHCYVDLFLIFVVGLEHLLLTCQWISEMIMLKFWYLDMGLRYVREHN